MPKSRQSKPSFEERLAGLEEIIDGLFWALPGPVQDMIMVRIKARRVKKPEVKDAKTENRQAARTRSELGATHEPPRV